MDNAPIPQIPITINKPANEFFRTYLLMVVAGTGNKISPLDTDIIEECFTQCKGILDTEGRKIICKRLGITNANLNNYVKKLRDKHYFDENNRLSSSLNIASLRIPKDIKNVSALVNITITDKNLKKADS